MNEARIGLDARLTRQMSVGMKTYVREMVARLPHVAPEFCYVPFTNGSNFGWSEQVQLPVALFRARLSIVHFLAVYVPIVIPARYVMTIHDLIHLRFPQYFKTKVGPYYRTIVRRACSRAARVITDDERTADDLFELLQVDRSKIRIIPLGVAERFSEPVAAHVGQRPYLLYVGNHRRHKNLITLFEAWSALPQTWPIDLYVTGMDDFGGELQRRSSSRRSIRALGDVTAESLIAYYSGARAVVQPALREGFGLPMLEAMAAGTPVVACRDAVPQALAGAALTFPARDPAALRVQLENVLSDEGLRVASIKLGREVAQRLSWDRCARATADVYREVLEEK